jgi:biopolymer transport protein ExbD
MKFYPRRRRAAPAVIVIALIDVLIVLLIFLMVTTTFKQQPAIQLALPESSQIERGASAENNLVVTIAPQEPFIYLSNRPVTLDKLMEELASRAKASPDLSLAIRADRKAPWEQIVKVMDAAKAAQIRNVRAATQEGGRL